MRKQTKYKLWGTSFAKEPAQETLKFMSGRDVVGLAPADESLVPYDIWGSKAHCLMLVRQGIISKSDGKKILLGLGEVERFWEEGKFKLDLRLEDVHTNIENHLSKKLGGEVAGRLHTGRSRNDQIVLDTRLYIRDQVIDFSERILELTEVLVALGKKHKNTVMPGFTHHQHAMVTTFGHTLLSFASMLLRDGQRFESWLETHNNNPLGGAAAYGTSFPLERRYTTKLLGFDAPELNSLDSITTRWEPEADFVFAVAQLMNHLSSLAQTLIIFSTPEFGFINLSEEHSTGSSIMPQKKNPDSLEVVKGKTAWVQGQLVGLLSMGRAAFVGYNRDTQWTKYIVTDVVRECLYAPSLMKDVLSGLKINKNAMELQAGKNFITSTDLLEELVNRGLVFREAKVIAEKAIKYSRQKGGGDVVDYQSFQKALGDSGKTVNLGEEDFRTLQEPSLALHKRKSLGSPAPSLVEKAAREISGSRAAISGKTKRYAKKISDALALTKKEIQNL